MSGSWLRDEHCAAKAGIARLTKIVTKEYGSRNITVNAVAPGCIKSDMTLKLGESMEKAFKLFQGMWSYVLEFAGFIAAASFVILIEPIGLFYALSRFASGLVVD